MLQLPFTSPETKEGLSVPFAFSSLGGILAVRAENYCVQLYSLFDDREIAEVRLSLLYQCHE